MRAEEIRSVISENPHQPVRLHLTSGRDVIVQALDYIFFPPDRQTVVISTSEGGFAIVDCATVSEIQIQPRPKRSQK
jgi:hypothetical protein